MAQPKAFNDAGVQFAFDSTSLNLGAACLRKYRYKMIDGWTYPDKSVHLLFGGWYATALEHYHQHIAAGADTDEATLLVVHEALIATWITNEDGTGQPWTTDHNTKTRENLIRTIVWYLAQFGVDDSCKTVILSTGEAAVEHSFRLEVDNGIIFSGHLDRLIDYGGKNYVQDQKTTGTTITARFFNGFSPDNQMSMYTFAGKSIFGIPVSGVMVDGAQIAVGFSRFERGFTFRSEDQLNEWYDDSMTLVERIQHHTKENYFPLNPTSCGDYGGCEYRNVCSKSPSVREKFLKGTFEKGKRWDPLETR